MSKNMMEPEGPQMTEQYGCMLDKPRYTRARTHMRTSTRPGTPKSRVSAVFWDAGQCPKYRFIFTQAYTIVRKLQTFLKIR
jgi:hypothetical protein